MLTTIVGATVGLTGFVVTVTVLAIQMATGTFSARYMRIWYRSRLLKATLTVLAGALAFSFSLLRQAGAQQVPNIGVSVAGFLVVLSLALFLLFFDRLIHLLRPVAVARRVIGNLPPASVWIYRPDRCRPAGAHGGEPAGRVHSGRRCPRPDPMGQQA